MTYQKVYFYLLFISFARPKKTKQRKRGFFQAIFLPLQRDKTGDKTSRNAEEKSAFLNFEVLSPILRKRTV